MKMTVVNESLMKTILCSKARMELWRFILLSATILSFGVAPCARAQYPTADGFNPGAGGHDFPYVYALAAQTNSMALPIGSGNLFLRVRGQ